MNTKSSFQIFQLLITVITIKAFEVSDICPAEYLRLCWIHSYCLLRNQTCEFVDVAPPNDREIEVIVETHNEFRNRVAAGRETGLDSLPSAARMLALSWDIDLAMMAQSWAEQCIESVFFPSCVASSSYPVSQVLLLGQSGSKKPQWSLFVRDLHSYVKNFSKSDITSFKIEDSNVILAAMLHADTYRIGCGLVTYRVSSISLVKQIYVCHYGPNPFGDIITFNDSLPPLYEEGPPCSKCPLNSCCGRSCPTAGHNEALCILLSRPPTYPPPHNRLFFCDFKADDPNCELKTNGGRWWHIETVDGIILSGTDWSNRPATMYFMKRLDAKKGSCLRLTLKIGPDIRPNATVKSTLKIEFKLEDKQYSLPIERPLYQFKRLTIPMFFEGSFQLFLTFTAFNRRAQSLDLKEVELLREPCEFTNSSLKRIAKEQVAKEEKRLKASEEAKIKKIADEVSKKIADDLSKKIGSDVSKDVADEESDDGDYESYYQQEGNEARHLRHGRSLLHELLLSLVILFLRL